MSGNIFVSYRRDDCRHAAGRLVDHLEREFGTEKLFLDVDSIELGLDFTKVLEQQVAQCDVMLVLMGRDWISIAGPEGHRRLDDPNDFVRIEIEAALKRDIRVIPVLVDGAELPQAKDLPVSISQLSRRQATRISHESFTSDAVTLTEALAEIVEDTSKPAPASIAVDPPEEATAAPEWSPPRRPSRGIYFGAHARPPLSAKIVYWVVAVSPIWLGILFVFSVNSSGLSASDFRWFSFMTGQQTGFAVPLVASLVLILVRSRSYVRMSKPASALATILIVVNLGFIFWLGR
ncbi:MAG: toll/interleukin-1 receptor domain-containing protein [Roseobacter sp.]